MPTIGSSVVTASCARGTSYPAASIACASADESARRAAELSQALTDWKTAATDTAAACN